MKCTRCEAYNNKEGINCQKYFGVSPCKYLFYGEMFGKEECKIGEPFVGKSGDILIRLLASINLTKQEVCISNVCKCYIKDNKTPSKKILDSCFIHCIREINEINPELIIAMGASACYALTDIPVEEFKHYRGKLIYSKKIKRKIFIINHPAAILYNPDKKKDIESDFLKIPKLLTEEPKTVKYYKHRVIDTQEKFDYVFDLLLNKPTIFDMETEGLDPYNKSLNIRTIQLGLDQDNIFILTPEIIYKNIDKLRILFETNPIIGQDFAFDAKWIYVKLGIFILLWEHDACLAEFLICGMKNNDLDFLTGKYNPDYYGYWDEVKKAGGAHRVQDKELLYNYGGSDIGTLYPIHIKQQKTLFKTNQYNYFKNIMMPCNKVLTKMSLRGVQIDIKTLKKVDSKFKKRAEKSLYSALILPGIRECEGYFNKKFNPRSPVMLRWLLLDYYKLPVLKKTKPSKSHPDGQPKLSQKEMEIYAEKHKNKYCQIMEKYRSINTVRKNFLSGTVPKLKNGIAHTTYSLHSTTTGRPNSKNPNLLNLPSKKEYLEVKNCYTARDGFVLLVADKAQIEVRVASVMYYDKNLIALCNEEGKDDFHSIITAKVFNVTYDDIYNAYQAGDKDATDKRRICKSITFGILYGMGEEKLAYQMGVSLNEAKRFIRDYFDMFPDLEREIENAKKFVVEHGYIDTYFKFRRYFPKHSWDDHDTLREAVNTVIQGTAWNLMQLSLINIDRKLEENKMESGIIMQVYDSVVVETEKSEIAEVAKIIKPTMENINKPYPILNEVKIKTDVEIGKSLYGLEKYI